MWLERRRRRRASDQGKNLRRAWWDELGLWRAGGGERAFDELLLPAVRIGRPQIAVTTTPKPTALVRRLLCDRRRSFRA